VRHRLPRVWAIAHWGSRGMTNRTLTIGIDLGGTFIKAGLVDGEGVILDRASRSTDLSRGPVGLLEDMARLVEALLDSPGDGSWRDDVIAVGLGSPGPLSPSRGTIYKCANLPGLEGFAIRDGLGEKLGMASSALDRSLTPRRV